MSFPYGKTGIAIREAVTESGKVRGVAGNNPRFTVFKGIPYAAPPVGDLRWRMPQPPEPWEGVRDCSQFGNIPYQFSMHRHADNMAMYEMSEDCLYINVWTPATSPDEKLPVLFFNYGGAFCGGQSNLPHYDGEAMCKRGVVYVTFNYRTGPLGLFTHPEMREENPYGSSGNFYWFDQIAALKWTRRNIAAFGGDPDHITIMGHSSGAVAVTGIATSPLTKGDMVGCMILSNPITWDFQEPDGHARTSPFWLPQEEMEKRGVEYMELCGCKNLEEMRKLSCAELNAAYDKTPGKFCQFRGVIDGYVFPENPYDMYLHGENHDINYFVGYAADEGMNPRSVLTRENVAGYAKNFGEDEEKFIDFCGTLSDGELSDGLLDPPGMSCELFCETQLKNGMKPAYYYCTTRRAPGDNAGAYHGIEFWYFNQTLDRDWRPYTGGDYELSRIMSDYWANFVKTGDPNGPGLPAWPAYTEDNKQTMMLDVAPWLGQRPLSKVQKFKINHFLNKK